MISRLMEASRTRLPVLAPWLVWVLIFSPAIFMAEEVRRQAVDVMCFDDWENVPMLKKWHDGTLSWNDLWSVQIQHRPVVPRVIVIALTSFSGGDNRWQQYFSFGLSALTAVLVARLLCITLGRSRWVWPLSFLGVLWMVSPVLYQNFFWATLFWMAIPPMCMVGILLVLRDHADVLGWGRLGAGITLALTGTLSFSHGLVLWPVLAVYVLLQPAFGPIERRALQAGVVALVAAITIKAYFTDFTNRSFHAYELQVGQNAFTHTVSLLEWENFTRVCRFACGLVGNGLARSAFDSHQLVERSQFIGAFIIAGLLIAGALCVFSKTGHHIWRQALPWLALGFFGLGIALAVAVGRAHLGEHRCTVPRYFVGTLHVVVATVVLGFLWLREWSARTRLSRLWPQRVRYLGVAMVTALAVTQISVWEYSMHLSQIWNNARHQARAILTFIRHDKIMPWSINTLDNTYPFVRKAALTMEELGWMRTKLLTEARIGEFRRGDDRLSLGRAMVEHISTKDGVLTLKGYARFGPGRPADLIAILGEGSDQILGFGVPRPRTLLRLFNVDFEFTNFYDVPLGDMSFWEAQVPLTQLKGAKSLQFWAIDEEKRRVQRFERKIDLP